MQSKGIQANTTVGNHTPGSAYDETILQYAEHYCVFDRHLKLTSYSADFVSLYPALSAVIKQGLTYARFLSALVEFNAIRNLDSLENVDQWLNEQLEAIRSVPKFVHQLRDDRWMEFQCHSGSQGDYIFVIADITQFIRQQQQLQLATDKFQSFAALAADWYWELDRELKYVYHSTHRNFVNGNQVINYSGRSRVDMVERNCVRDDQLAKHNACLREHREVDAVLTLMTDTGNKRYCHILAKPLYDNNDIFSGFIGCGRDITEQTLAQQQLDSHARIDYLTGLLNKRAFDGQLGEQHLIYRHKQAEATLCVIDLDCFKQINEESGHAAGDDILKTLGQQFRRTLGQDAIIGRIGGDEFAAILPMDITAALPPLNALKKQIASIPFIWLKKTHFIGASIGVTQLDPTLDPSRCLANANTACQQAKHSGRDQIVIHNPDHLTIDPSIQADNKQVKTNSLAKRRHTQPMVAIVMDTLHSYQKYMSTGIERELAQAGMRSIRIVLTEYDLAWAESERNEAPAFSDLMKNENIAGIIALTSSVGGVMSVESFTRLVSSVKSIPVVHQGAIGNHVDTVAVNNKTAIRELMDHITQQIPNGKIGFIKGFGHHSDSAVRERAFRAYCKEHGITVHEELIIDGNFREAETYKAVSDLLATGIQVDAFVAANDNMAVAAVHAAQAFGLDVPHDIIIVGFDDRNIATECTPPLTTIRIDLNEHARATANQLIQRMKSEAAQDDYLLRKTATRPFEQKLINGQLIIRGTSQVGLQQGLSSTHRSIAQSHYSAAVADIVSILEIEQGYQQITGETSLSQAFLDTLYNDSQTFETLLDQFEHDASCEFEAHNVIHELHSGIATLLLAILQHDKKIKGFATLIRLKHKLSTIMYRAQVRKSLDSSRDQQAYDRFHSSILQCQNISSVFDSLDDVLAKYSIGTAYVVLNNTNTSINMQLHQDESFQTLVYARRQGRRENTGFHRIPKNFYLPIGFELSDTNGNLLIQPLNGHGTQCGYLIMEPGKIHSTIIGKIASCIAASVVNCNQLEEQLLHAHQLRAINAELARKTNYDSITGLPNRRQYLGTLEQLLHDSTLTSQPFSVVQISLSDLKRIGMQHGIGNSDFLIRSLSARLADAVGAESRLFRTGAIDFSIILECQAQDLNEKLNELANQLEQPYELAGSTITMNYHAGVANFPNHGQSRDELLNNATIALQEAEQSGEDCFVVFDPSDERQELNKWQIDQLMRQGLNNDEFQLYFQPRVNVATGKIKSFEALIRWFRPDDGSGKAQPIGPYIFIPIAEETGFISQLGDFVLSEACKQLTTWNAMGLDTRLSVNLSTRELEENHLVDRVISTVKNHQLDTSRIELEVTESSAMMDIESTIEKLSDLQQHGFEIAIDDFGTEYSSLNYLKRLPANYLKIDRSFVKDITEADGGDSADAAIVRAVVTLGHSLGHKIVAEGVETEEQLAFLSMLGVDEIQGYYFSPPVDAIEAGKLLQAQLAVSEQVA